MMEKIKGNWAAIILIIAIFSAGGGYAIDRQSLGSEVAANTAERLFQAFRVLEARILQGQRITPKERFRFCDAARRLRLTAGPAYRMVC
ncbi:MAG: hypothetical protein O2797_02495 [Bacteroidetes bacterium]|nr:hypothetical protein [Bacteroidota bacterium]